MAIVLEGEGTMGTLMTSFAFYHIEASEDEDGDIWDGLFRFFSC